MLNYTNKRPPSTRFNVGTLWAFRRTPKVPTAYALPQRKKDFRAGRPTLSFAFMRPLLEATSRLLHRLCCIAFPLAFAKGGVHELLSQARAFF